MTEIDNLDRTDDFDAKCAFYAALSKAQGQIMNANKDAVNPHFKNRYATLASVWDVIRKPLSDNGLSILQFPEVQSAEGKIFVVVETTLMHAGGYAISTKIKMPVARPDAQGIGGAITYARRYSLLGIGVAPDDDDGNAAVGFVGGNVKASPMPKAQSRDLYTELQHDIDAADSQDALTTWSNSRAGDIAKLPDQWRDELRSRYLNKFHSFEANGSDHVEQ